MDYSSTTVHIPPREGVLIAFKHVFDCSIFLLLTCRKSCLGCLLVSEVPELCRKIWETCGKISCYLSPKSELMVLTYDNKIETGND